MPEFSIAIIGAGGISRAHINAAKASNGRIEIAGIVDPLEVARKAAGFPAFATIEQLFSSEIGEKLNALIVCTPPSARIENVKAALDRKLAVLTEKPLAHTLNDAKVLADLASKHPNIATAVGYCHRFTPAIIEMKKRIAAGEIGDVIRFENTFAANLIRLKDHWMSDPGISGGGALIDTGCHSLDLLLYLLGPAKIRAAGFKHAWTGRGETHATLLLRTDQAVAIINSGWLEPERFAVSVIGAGGSLHYDYNNPTDLLLRRTTGGEETIPVESHDIRFARQLEAFADAAMRRTPAIHPATFADGLQTAQSIHDAYALRA